MTALPPVSWTLNGKPVLMGNGWSGSAKVDFGFDQFRGKVLEDDLLRARAGPFSVVRGTTPDGWVVWEGKLSRKPTVRRGVAEIEAQGYGSEAVKATRRLLYLTYETALWSLLEAPPVNDTAGGQTFYMKFPRSVEPNCLRLQVSNVTAGINQDEYGGWGLGITDAPVGLTYMSFDWVSNDTPGAHFQWKVFRADYLVRTPTLVTTSAITGTSGSVATAITNNPSAVYLWFQKSSAGNAVFSTYNFLVKNILLRGIATANTMTDAAVVSDIFARLGWATTKVEASTFNFMPFDVKDEQSWADAMSYVSQVRNRFWAAWETDGGQVVPEYASYGGKVWTTDQAHGCNVALDDLLPSNRIIVKYPDSAGTTQQVIADVSPDPLAGTGETVEKKIELSDVQPSSTVPAGIASTIAAQEATPQRTGSIDLYAVRDGAGRGNPFRVRPGSVIRISDHAEDPAALHRVVEVTYSQSGVRGEIGTPSLETLMGQQFPYLGPDPELPPDEPLEVVEPEAPELSDEPSPWVTPALEMAAPHFSKKKKKKRRP